MANEEKSSSPSSIDPSNGFCRKTKTYHSLRPDVPLPPSDEPISITSYAVSLLRNLDAASDGAFLINAGSGYKVTFGAFLRQANSLACSLSRFLYKDDVALIITPNSIYVPMVYFSLLSLGVVVSPSNPLCSPSEIAHQIKLVKPNVVFSVSALAQRLRSEVPDFPDNLDIIDIDSPHFLSMLDSEATHARTTSAIIHQSDKAVILFSSGTTGKVKGVMLTHRNFIATIASFYYCKLHELKSKDNGVSLVTLPLFHVLGFVMLIRALALGECVVLMEKFGFTKMLEAVERYKVTFIAAAPPLVVALAKSELVDNYNLNSLKTLGCGGAPLGKEVAKRFRARFPHVEIVQSYGMTETAGSIARQIGPVHSARYGSAGRLFNNMEAKIVDPENGDALPPGRRGELWLRGPMVMKGYAGYDAATAETIDSQGWLRTGDLCYFDSDGYLFVVDRLKELIKYKAYQIPPAELEHILHSIPDIADAAVIPYPDEEAGEVPMAYVVRKPGSTISAGEVMDLVAKQVAPYKKIRSVEFVNSIPKSQAGKILRRALRNHAVSSDAASKL